LIRQTQHLLKPARNNAANVEKTTGRINTEKHETKKSVSKKCFVYIIFRIQEIVSVRTENLSCGGIVALPETTKGRRWVALNRRSTRHCEAQSNRPYNEDTGLYGRLLRASQ
jgi:hypothetical protein